MIFVAKKGDEEIEARRLSRRGFLRLAVGGAASVAVPTKTYAFFGNILRTPAPTPFQPHLLAAVGIIPILMGGILIGGSPLLLKGK